jgi:hypothetical protein
VKVDFAEITPGLGAIVSRIPLRRSWMELEGARDTWIT